MAIVGSGAGRARSILIHEYVTGGGLAGLALPPSLAIEGRAMRRALAEDFAAVPGVRAIMTLDARLPDEPGPWEVVRVGPGREPSTFARLAAEVDYTLVVAPESEGILLDRARTIDRVGGRSLGSAPAAVAAAGNKLVTFDRFRAAGLRTPTTLAIGPRDGWPRRLTFPTAELAAVGPIVEVPEPPSGRGNDAEVEHPAVLKPIDGAGALHTFVLAGEVAWPDPTWTPDVAVIQPWVDGSAMSAAVLFGPDGRPHVLGIASQEIAVERGRVTYRGGLAPWPFGEPEWRMAARVAGALPGLLGWVGIDYVATGRGEPVVIEVNPRPTTSLVAYRAMLGPGMLAGAWLGLLDGSEDGLPEELLADVRRYLGMPIRFDIDGTRDFGGARA